MYHTMENFKQRESLINMIRIYEHLIDQYRYATNKPLYHEAFISVMLSNSSKLLK